MARARSIMPSVCINEHLAECSADALNLYLLAPIVADKAGRLEDRPLRVRLALGVIFAARPELDPDRLLDELARNGLILRYEVDGKRYIQILDWDKLQSPHMKEAESVIPPPPEPGQTTVPMRQQPGHAKVHPGQAGVTPGSDGPSTDRAPESPGSDGPSTEPAALTSDPCSLTLDPGLLTSDLSADQPSAGSAASGKTAKRMKGEGKTVETWDAYAGAYRLRHGTEPLRNRQVNGQLAKFVEAVGADDAPKLAAFYLASTERFYVDQCHPVSLMLRDAQKLRTQWARSTGTPRTAAACSDDPRVELP